MAIKDDLLAKFQKLQVNGETRELGVRKTCSWVECKLSAQATKNPHGSVRTGRCAAAVAGTGSYWRESS